MGVNIIAFGQLAEIIGHRPIISQDIADTDALIAELHGLYPFLSDIPYRIAVDKEIISQKTALTNQSQIALLPPYSGG